MNSRKTAEGVIMWIALLGALYFALRLPFMVYGGTPQFHDDVLQPRNTPTPRSPEREMTQQAFALMFFTPTHTAGPTQPFFAFLLPITGATETFTPTPGTAFQPTLSVTPARTLLPVHQTQTRVNVGGGGGGGVGSTFTSTPFKTSTPGSSPSPSKTQNLTLTVSTTSVSRTPTASFTPAGTTTDQSTPMESPTTVPDTPIPRPTLTSTSVPATNTAVPATNTPVPADTDTPVPQPTDTGVPAPTETVQAYLPGDSITLASSTASPDMMKFILIYLLGATFLGIVFRRR